MRPTIQQHVYVLRNNRTKDPIYVGRGKGWRSHKHLDEATTVDDPDLARVYEHKYKALLNAVIHDGGIQIDIFVVNDDVLVKAVETTLITKYNLDANLMKNKGTAVDRTFAAASVFLTQEPLVFFQTADIEQAKAALLRWYS